MSENERRTIKELEVACSLKRAYDKGPKRFFIEYRVLVNRTRTEHVKVGENVTTETWDDGYSREVSREDVYKDIEVSYQDVIVQRKNVNINDAIEIAKYTSDKVSMDNMCQICVEYDCGSYVVARFVCGEPRDL